VKLSQKARLREQTAGWRFFDGFKGVADKVAAKQAGIMVEKINQVNRV